MKSIHKIGKKPRGLLILSMFLGSALIGFMASNAYAAAKANYNDVLTAVQARAQKECSQQKFTQPQFKNDCITTFQNYAIRAYYAASQTEVNNLKQAGCTNNTLWSDSGYGSCSAAIDGIGYAQSIMNNPQAASKAAAAAKGSGAAAATTSKKTTASTSKPPPISDCDKLKDPADQKKCKQAYQACNQPPYSPAHIANCKQQAVSGAGQSNNNKNSGGNNKNNGNSGGNNQPQGGQGGHCTDYNHCDLVSLYVNPFIRLLSIVVGLVVAGSLIMGGIQYTASSGDPQKIGAAKTRITNALIAFFAFAFMYAFLNFLIPGGIF